MTRWEKVITRIDQRLSQIKNDKRRMRMIRRILFGVDILSLVIPAVLYNLGIIEAAPAGLFTMLSILNITLFVRDWSTRNHLSRKKGGQVQINREFGGRNFEVSARPRLPRRIMSKPPKPPWEQ